MLIYDFSGIYNFKDYSIKPEDIPASTEIISIVITRWDSYDVRRVIREMFAFGKNNKTLNYKLLFLYDLPENPSDKDITKISQENEEHHDMLIPNVEDNYHAVGLKLLSSFNWISKLNNVPNLKWVSKMDDDMMVNFTKYDEYFSNPEINHDRLHCPINSGMSVIRDMHSKW